MARVQGSNSGSRLVSSINTPELTDFATGNYATVIEKTMDNFSQAMKALEGKISVESSEYQRISKIAQQAEEARLAHARADSQSGSSGSDWGSAFASLGKSLVTTVLAKQQLEEQAKQQAFENNLKTESMQMDREKFEYQMESAKSEEARQQLDSLLQGRMSEIEAKAQEMIISSGDYNAGLTYYKEAVANISTDPFFASLSDTNKMYVSNFLNKGYTTFQSKYVNETVGQQQALVNDAVTAASSRFLTQNAETLAQIKTGAKVFAPGEVMETVNKLIESALQIPSSDTSFASILTNQRNLLRYYTDVTRPINDALVNYFNTTASFDADAQRWMQGASGLAELELANQKGAISDQDFVTGGGQLLTSLGLPSSVSNFPTVSANVLATTRQREEEQQKFEQNLAEQATRGVTDANDPRIQQARNYNNALELYNTINNKGAATIQERINQLEHEVKNNPSNARLMGYDTQLNLYKEWVTDANTTLPSLTKEALRLEGDIATLKRRMSETRTVGGSEGGVPNYRVDPTTGVEVPDPQASMEEIDAKNRELTEVRRQIASKVSYWQQYGLNINKPDDPTYLKNLETSTQAARDWVKQNGQNTNAQVRGYPSSNPTTPTQDNSDLTRQLTWEVNRTKAGNAGVDYVHNSKLGEKLSPYLTQVDGVNTQYTSALQKLIQAHATDTPISIQDLTRSITSPDTKGMGTDEATFFKQYETYLRNKITDVDALLKNKKNWWKTKNAERNQSAVPSNFSSGNAPNQEPTQQVALPHNSAPLSPTMPLRGNLAKLDGIGYAPFKTGKVYLTSQYGMRNGRMHQGIDLDNNDDPRVATIQGGEVVVATGTKDPNGYGNTVVIKTPDGYYELYGHLKGFHVKVGQKVDPGTVIGIMGSTGRSTDDHVHMGVTRDPNIVNNLTASEWLNPIDYLKKFTGTVELPRTANPQNRPSSNGISSSTGYYYNMGNNLIMMGNYVFDRNTKKLRQATASEVANKSSYIPIATVQHNQRSSSPNTSAQESNGGTVIERYRVPQEAKAKGTFLFVYPTGRTSSRSGQPILAVQAWKDGKVLWTRESVSGRTGISGDRDTPGAGGMLPDGSYTFGTLTSGTVAGVGDKFLPIIPTFGTNRSALGIHEDADNDGDTEGCLALLSKADRDAVIAFARQNPGMKLYVNTRDVERVQGSSPGVSRQTGTPMSVNGQSPTNTGRIKNDPTANYGWSRLRSNPELARGIAAAADALGIPAQWVADYLGTETSNFSNLASGTADDAGSIGIFQATRETRAWLHPGMSGSDYALKGVYWQLTQSLVPYIKAVTKGKPINTIFDFGAAIWGGERAFNMSEAQRRTSLRARTRNGVLTYDEWKKKIGRDVGRKYSAAPEMEHRTVAINHTHPRDNCAICRQMQINGEFVTHIYDGYA